MSISFSGLASGLDTSSWVEALVSVKQQQVTKLESELNALNTKNNTLSTTKSIFNDLRTALEKFTDTKFGGTFDLFGKNTATVSNTDVFTATAEANAARQNYDIKIQQLATYTKATSTEAASAVADDETKLSSFGVTAGTLSVYVDGARTPIEITGDTTLGELKEQLDTAGIATDINENGVLTLSAKTEGSTIHIGATTDKSNFVSLTGLTRNEDGTYSSTNSLFKASIASTLTSADSGFKAQITEGTFTIGNATFTIGEKTTLSSLISEINSNEEAQATASWDDTTGKLTITSKKEGAAYINIEAGTSNFTDVMGFTSTSVNEDGTSTSKMLLETQELGQNALLTINGTSIISTSNTVTSDISRIEGVTINLKRANTEEDGNTTLKITQNHSGLVDAAKGFVEAYNKAVEQVDKVTASGADLARESTLTSIKNTLRTYANSSNDMNGGVYNLLAQIGISTGEADSTNLSTNTDKLKLDEEKFIKALEENPDGVKSLLTGDNGVFAMMEKTVEQALSGTNGFFDVKASSIKSDIKTMKDKISKQQTKVNDYQVRLEKKFANMELVISQMQQNYSSFLST